MCSMCGLDNSNVFFWNQYLVKSKIVFLKIAKNVFQSLWELASKPISHSSIFLFKRSKCTFVQIIRPIRSNLNKIFPQITKKNIFRHSGIWMLVRSQSPAPPIPSFIAQPPRSAQINQCWISFKINDHIWMKQMASIFDLNYI